MAAWSIVFQVHTASDILLLLPPGPVLELYTSYNQVVELRDIGATEER